MKKSFLLAGAMALFALASCGDDKVDLNTVLEDGFFVQGPATGAEKVEPKYMMTQGINEVEMDKEGKSWDQAKRNGMYEKYIVLEANKDFYLVLNEANVATRYSAELTELDLSEQIEAANPVYEHNPQFVVWKGELVSGETAEPMQVTETGLYHIILDLNKAGDLDCAQIVLLPVSFGLRGSLIDSNWAEWQEMELNVTEDGKYVYTHTMASVSYSEFKFTNGLSWKMTLDKDGKVKAHTNIGDEGKNGGGNIAIPNGTNVTISLTFDLAAGEIAKSFTYAYDGDLEIAEPSELVVGFRGSCFGADHNWQDPAVYTAAKGTYNEAESVCKNESTKAGTYVYDIAALPILSDGEFKLTIGTAYYGVKEKMTITGLTTAAGADNFTIGLGDAGVYSVKITVQWNGVKASSINAVFTKTDDVEITIPDYTDSVVELVGSGIAAQEGATADATWDWGNEMPASNAGKPTKNGDVYTWTWTNVQLTNEGWKIRTDNAAASAGLNLDLGSGAVDTTNSVEIGTGDNIVVAAGTYNITLVIDAVANTKTITIVAAE